MSLCSGQILHNNPSMFNDIVGAPARFVHYLQGKNTQNKRLQTAAPSSSLRRSWATPFGKSNSLAKQVNPSGASAPQNPPGLAHPAQPGSLAWRAMAEGRPSQLSGVAAEGRPAALEAPGPGDPGGGSPLTKQLGLPGVWCSRWGGP